MHMSPHVTSWHHVPPPGSIHMQYLAPTIGNVLPRMAVSLELLARRIPKALMQMSFRLDHINFRLDRTNTQLSELPCYSLCP